jgi:aldehyde dehydrogenase (NAD+)
MYNSAFRVVEEGGKILAEGGVLSGEGYESMVVKPAIAEAENHETYNTKLCPVLY